MIKYCLEKWDANKEKLRKVLSGANLEAIEYKDLVKMVVRYVLNDETAHNDEAIGYDHCEWNWDRITQIDDGEYRGTLLYMIPRNTYQPSEYDYLMAYVNYGSCSGCDALQYLQSIIYPNQTEKNVNDFMTLCKDILTSIIKPYNYGWRYDERFDVCEVEE